MKVGTGERTAASTGERTCGPLPHANFHVYRGNVSPLWGEKPIFGPVSKNNTGMAALRAGLPVIIEKKRLAAMSSLKICIIVNYDAKLCAAKK